MSGRRLSASERRRARRAAAQKPGLGARLRGLPIWLRSLTGWTRVLVFAVIGLAAVGLIAGTGSTAYALSLENHDEFCASCHTQPETQYYQQTVQQSTASLASFHATKGVRCIDCHSGGGIFGRVTGLSQGAQDLMSYYSANYHNPAITTSKLDDGSCTKCHNDAVTQGGFDNHYHIFLARWQSVDPNAAHCVDCHVSHPAMDAAQKYLASNQVQAVCEQCHAVLRGGE